MEGETGRTRASSGKSGRHTEVSGWTSSHQENTRSFIEARSREDDAPVPRRRRESLEALEDDYSDPRLSESESYSDNEPDASQKLNSESLEAQHESPRRLEEIRELVSPPEIRTRHRRSRDSEAMGSNTIVETEDIENQSPLMSQIRSVGRGRGSRESQEIERNIEPIYINLRELPKLPKVVPINKAQFLTSTYKYEKPLSDFKMRVRLLKYPGPADRNEWNGDFLVLDDRVFSWQEKVFSKFEAELYSHKKNLVSGMDELYHKELIQNPSSRGKYLYSYTQSDLATCLQSLPRPTIRRCGAKHSRLVNKVINNMADHKVINSDDESVVDEQELAGDEYTRSILPQHSIGDTLLGSIGCFNGLTREQVHASSGDHSYEDEIVQHLRRNLQRDRKLRQEVEESEKTKQARDGRVKAERKLRQETQRRQQEIKMDTRVKKRKEAEQKKSEKEEEYVKKWVGSKRPSLALSAQMRGGHTASRSAGKGATKPLAGQSVSEEMESEWESDEDVGLSRHPRNWRPLRGRRTGTGSLEEILGPRVMGSRSHSLDTSMVNRDSEQQSDTDIVIRSPGNPPKLNRNMDGPQVRVSTMRRSRRSISTKSRSRDQSMFIMVALPHMPRQRREFTVCVVKTLPRAGVVQLKPAFGYRNIEAKRNHIYRLSWELFSLSEMEKAGVMEAGESYEDNGNVLLSPGDAKDKPNGDLLQHEAFQTIPRNEIRLVYMGEIISSHGFSQGPLCVHYMVDLPKGWRNDSVLSSLQGLTHCCSLNWSGVSHFSQDFFGQLAFSMDSVEEDEAFSRPMMLFMVVATDGRRVRDEGYAYVPIPSTPGHHSITVQTWKLAQRSILDKMRDVFLDVVPSLQDIKAVHIPNTSETEECRRPNRLGLQTEPSGYIKLRFHVIHQTHSINLRQSDRIDLLEKMSSATILRSVQTVIEAFQRAQQKAAAANH